MLQITNMRDFDRLHGFLYELRPSVQREVTRMEPDDGNLRGSGQVSGVGW